VAVSSVAEERTGEVGGIQNTFTNLGSSLGTALAGSVLIAGLTAAFLSGIADNPDVPPEVVEEADVRLAAGAPFLSDEQLEEALADSGLDAATTDAIVEENEEARLAGLRASLFIIAVVAIVATFFARRLPVAAIGREPVRDPAAAP
jgi:hypothetical protein